MCGSDALHRGLYGDIKASLSDQMLTKIDRMSMAAILEARPPLVDHRIVEFAARLPPADQLRGSTPKYLLRPLARQLLPPEIPNRRKHGFDVPVSAWLRGTLKPFAEGVLSPLTLRRGVFGSRRPSNASGSGIRPAARALESGCGCS